MDVGKGREQERKLHSAQVAWPSAIIGMNSDLQVASRWGVAHQAGDAEHKPSFGRILSQFKNALNTEYADSINAFIAKHIKPGTDTFDTWLLVGLTVQSTEFS